MFSAAENGTGVTPTLRRPAIELALAYIVNFPNPSRRRGAEVEDKVEEQAGESCDGEFT
jgi:hypothetical protein